MGESWDNLGVYRKVLEGLLLSMKVKVQRKSRKVWDGLKKPGESATVLAGLLGSGRVWKGSVGLRMDLGIWRQWRLRETPGWSGGFRGDPRGLGRIMEGISSLEFKF